MKRLQYLCSAMVFLCQALHSLSQVQVVSNNNILLGGNTKTSIQGNVDLQTGTLQLETGPAIEIQGNFKVDSPANILWNVNQVLTGQQFQVSDTTYFNGNVQVHFAPNFTPQTNDSIRLITCTNWIGSIQDTIYPSGYTGYFLFSNGFLTLTNLNTIPVNGDLTIYAYLQGFYSGGGTMATVLINSGIGNNANETDSITVELHEITTPYNAVWSETTLLSTTGNLGLSIPSNMLNQSWFVVLKHRSHVATWSALPVFFGSNTSYDFRSDNTQAFGNNLANLGDGNWALFAGDINQDSAVDALDYVIMDPDIVQGNSGYLASDLNGDGSVDILDYLILEPAITQGINTQSP